MLGLKICPPLQVQHHLTPLTSKTSASYQHERSLVADILYQLILPHQSWI